MMFLPLTILFLSAPATASIASGHGFESGRFALEVPAVNERSSRQDRLPLETWHILNPEIEASTNITVLLQRAGIPFLLDSRGRHLLSWSGDECAAAWIANPAIVTWQLRLTTSTATTKIRNAVSADLAVRDALGQFGSRMGLQEAVTNVFQGLWMTIDASGSAREFNHLRLSVEIDTHGCARCELAAARQTSSDTGDGVQIEETILATANYIREERHFENAIRPGRLVREEPGGSLILKPIPTGRTGAEAIWGLRIPVGEIRRDQQTGSERLVWQ